MYKRLLGTALLFGLAATAPPVLAQAGLPCAVRSALVDDLGEKYHEELAGGGLQNERNLIEIFAARETGTFTILLSRPDGVSCILAFGTNWVGVFPAADPEGVAG